jgi:hypothetical protein
MIGTGIIKQQNKISITILRIGIIPKWFSLFIVFLILSTSLQAQRRRRGFYTKNAALAELSFLRYQASGSLIYERTFYYSRGVSLTGSTGIGAFYTSANTGKFNGFSVPVRINFILGDGDNHFEAGLGAGYTFGNKINKDLSPISPLLNIGYRYQQSKGKGLIFRAFAGTMGIGVGVGKGF